MKFYVMTLFPQMILDGLNTSITGRAIESGALCVEAVDIRDFSKNKCCKSGKTTAAPALLHF